VVKVKFKVPAGACRREGAEQGLTRDVEMAAVPRLGETLSFAAPSVPEPFDDYPFQVHVVHWYVDEPDPFVYVVLR